MGSPAATAAILTHYEISGLAAFIALDGCATKSALQHHHSTKLNILLNCLNSNEHTSLNQAVLGMGIGRPEVFKLSQSVKNQIKLQDELLLAVYYNSLVPAYFWWSPRNGGSFRQCSSAEATGKSINLVRFEGQETIPIHPHDPITFNDYIIDILPNNRLYFMSHIID